MYTHTCSLLHWHPQLIIPTFFFSLPLLHSSLREWDIHRSETSFSNAKSDEHEICLCKCEDDVHDIPFAHSTTESRAEHGEEEEEEEEHK